MNSRKSDDASAVDADEGDVALHVVVGMEANMTTPSASEVLRHDRRSLAFLWVTVAYLVATISALIAGIVCRAQHPLAIALCADIVATAVVFAFSVGLRNASTYDPYWSVVPPLIGVYFCVAPGSESARFERQVLVMLLVTLWAARLTHNWARGWRGLEHEDWRYVDLRRTSGRLFELVNLGGIHLVPTLIVFAGCLPLWSSLATGDRPLGVLDALAATVTLAGIGFEFFADNELRRFRLSSSPPGAILATGLWSWSRHPNYFGEILFWWGLALFGLAAGGFAWWTFAGAAAITVLFLFVSLPLIETRMRERRPGWVAHASRVSRLIPRPPRRE